MRERLAALSQVFAIELCAYALMSNHYHLVLRLRPERVAEWSDEEVITRWTRLFSEPSLISRYRKGDAMTCDERSRVCATLETWRERLGDLSWYMRCLNEYIARRANAEEGVTGHFWEARFKSQALLDTAALLQAMVYVDLNPVRAGMAATIGESIYTAAQQRMLPDRRSSPADRDTRFPSLAQLRERSEAPEIDALPFGRVDYLNLVDATGRCCVPGKRGSISGDESYLLSSLGFDPGVWVSHMRTSVRSRYPAVGSREHLRRHAARLNRAWVHGVGRMFALRRDGHVSSGIPGRSFLPIQHSARGEV